MFGLEFRPSGSLLIRTTYSSAFKPILAYDAVRPAEIYPFPNSVRDPAFDGQEFPVQVLTGGGTPLDLKPETSPHIPFGFVFAPNNSFRDRKSGVQGKSVAGRVDIGGGRRSKNKTQITN